MLAEEMKRYGMSAENDLYEVENTLRELQRQISQAGLAAFLGTADDELHEVEKNASSKTIINFTPIDRQSSGASSTRSSLNVAIIATKTQKKARKKDLLIWTKNGIFSRGSYAQFG